MNMDMLKSGLEAVLTPSPAVFIIGILIVVLLPILLHFVLSSTTDSSLPYVLLAGPSGAGKTALLTLFERGPQSKTEKPAAATLTHTSQIPATIELSVSEDATSSFRDDLDASGATAKSFLLVDTPGHPKLRQHALSRLAVSTAKKSPAAGKLKGVVFIVDAAALADGDSLPATAEYLYDLLLSLQKRMSGNKTSRPPAGIPVLVAANKLDLFTSLPAALVKTNLETELTRIRKARSKGLLDSGAGADDDGLSEADVSDDWLGEYGSEKFAFRQMLEFDIEVDVKGGNVVGEGPGVDGWWSWIAQCIV